MIFVDTAAEWEKEEKSFEREARTAFEGRARRKIYGFLIKQRELRPFSGRGADFASSFGRKHKFSAQSTF